MRLKITRTVRIPHCGICHARLRVGKYVEGVFCSNPNCANSEVTFLIKD